MVPYKSMGTSNGLSLTYRTDTVNVGPVLGIRESNNLSAANMPTQMTFKVDVEGVEHETHFAAEQGDYAMAYYFDGKNAQGEILKTGAYKVNYAISNNYGKNFYTTGSFGGAPLTNTGVPVPDTVSYTNTTERDLIINNQIDSIYGAGWGLSGVERLYPDPDDPDSVLLIQGGW